MQQISETPGLMYAPTYEVDDTAMMAKRQFISSCADDILVINSRSINRTKQKQPVFKFEDDKISVLDTNNHIHVINAIESSAEDIVKWLNDYDDYFNYYPNGSNFIEWEDDREEFWMTDFEYSLRSADEFKKDVTDMQYELKEGNE